MALLNASLLMGGLMIAVPIILHMTMRPKPRKLVFPALRFVMPRKEANQRRLNWKRWLLLALRCAALLLLALALARPSVASHLAGAWLTVGGLLLIGLVTSAIAGLAVAQQRGRWLAVALASVALVLVGAASVLAIQTLRDSPTGIGDQQAPVAAVLIFDTSPRMDYRLENKTRLEVAGDMARWIISQLPADSEVAVLDSATRTAVFSIDPTTAAKSVERLQSTFTPRPLEAVLDDALRLAATSPQERKELYVFTDLNALVWNSPALKDLRSRFEQAPEANVYLIDVGVAQPTNVALQDLRLSSELLPRDGELLIECDLQSLGSEGERIIELLVEDVDPQRPIVVDGKTLLPEARQRGRTTCALTPGSSERLQFRVAGLEAGVRHGVLRVLGQDGLAIDDERHFTVQVQDAWPILLAAPQAASMRFVAEALAPFEMREQGTARFDCVQARIEDLATYKFEEFAAVVLLDPPPLDDALWQRLSAFVETGRGLAVFLGSHAGDGEKFRSPAAEQVLGGTLARQVRTGGRDVFLTPHDYSHPVTTVYRDVASTVPWSQFPIFRHWELGLAADAHVVMYYNNGLPAVIERLVGAGKSLTVTTPLSDTARPPGRAAWNELAFGENPWPQFILVNEMLLHLVASNEQRLNYLSGQVAALPRREQVDPERFQLFPPRGDSYDVVANQSQVTVRFTETPGSYRLKGNRGGIVLRGFSVNLPAEASDLSRADPKMLDEVFGPNRVQALRERQQIERAQGRQRVGREFYPLLMLLAAIVLGLEHTLANRFYRRNDT